MWFVLIMVAVVVVVAQGQLLDELVDINDDQLSLFLNGRNNMVRNDQTELCKADIDSVTRVGTCMKSMACRYTNGKSLGRSTCNFLNTCCTYQRTCQQTSNARVTNFVNSGERPQSDETCTMTIEMKNDNVCQLRVDINALHLAPPVAGLCTNDMLTVDGSPEIPPMCGDDKKQHFYIHLNSKSRLRSKTINIQLSSDKNLKAPQWDLRITQLECPTKPKSGFFSSKKTNIDQMAEDFEILAPDGCLQYFLKSTGTFTNFGGFDTANPQLVLDQNYAICFKQSDSTCGVIFSGTIELARGGDSYIYVPTADGEYREIPTGGVISSIHPGPLYIIFVHKNAIDNAGFSLDYRLTTC